ncbi:MAG TPA: alkaline phosphatase family protein [Polyangiaceae bacterium]|nr:alkaline phosphatase family protein [Polyangiaceae bacterium]
MSSAAPIDTSVVFVEINEADRHFLEKFIAAGKLPTFERMRDAGTFVRTRVPGWSFKDARSWREIMPWIIWPSIYTGLSPEEHGIVAFGQDTSSIRGKCIWDVLDRHGLSVGVLGSLLSYPPRNGGHAAFYVPENLADDAECFPPAARPLQEFCVASSRNYSEGVLSQAAQSLRSLLRSRGSGVSLQTLARVVGQLPSELLLGRTREPERAMLLSYLVFDAFKQLYRQHRPRFASLHMNHIAYMQHRYWRAAEPERFPEGLSETDARFFKSPAQRSRYERKLGRWIERSFVHTDRQLAELCELSDDRTLIVVGTGLGQRPVDPIDGIHNPVVRLIREREFFDAVGLTDYRVLHQMNPDLTITFVDEAAAVRAKPIVEGFQVRAGEALFEVEQRDHQLFCEFMMPRGLFGKTSDVFIRHVKRPELQFPFARHVSQHPTNDQSTAQHHDGGWLLIWGKGRKVTALRQSLAVTEVAPALLELYGIAPQPWQRLDAPAFAVS